MQSVKRTEPTENLPEYVFTNNSTLKPALVALFLDHIRGVMKPRQLDAN